MNDRSRPVAHIVPALEFSAMAQTKRRSFGLLVAGVTLLGTALHVRGNETLPERSLAATAFTGVNVVDVKSGKIIANRTVVFRGDTIVAVQDAAIPPGPGLTIIPSRGKYLLPGLWDMHVHVADEHYLDLFVANGVTGVRDMGGGLDGPGDGCESLNPAILGKWRSEVAAGQRLGPELVISGPAVSGTGWPSSHLARTPEEARTAIAALQRQRVDFAKVYERIPLLAFNALAAEATRSKLPFAGHVPEEVGPLRAIRAGQRSIEHIRDALLVCFTDDRAELGRFFAEDQWDEEDRKWGYTAHAACEETVTAMQDNAVWLTPTLTVEKAKVSVEDPFHVNDERRRLLPPSVGAGYSAYVKGKIAQSRADRASERLWWRTQQKLVGRMSNNGVKLLAGTDSACEGGLPGYSLHLELEELVGSGLSPQEALRAATIEPARYFGSKQDGEVMPGYRANLLLLDANPLTDIRNTRRIHAVVLRGKLLRRVDLKRIEKPRQDR